LKTWKKREALTIHGLNLSPTLFKPSSMAEIIPSQPGKQKNLGKKKKKKKKKKKWIWVKGERKVSFLGE
jgi:hypothetical protein